MTDTIVVFITAANMRESKKIARALVAARLAACVNICSPICSVYRWQGKIEQARECLLLAKTTRPLYRRLEAEVTKRHGYSTPEIVAVPIVTGSRKYMRWLEESVKGAGKSAV